MATVYLAQDTERHTDVAVKVLSPDLAPLLGAERFAREIRITSGLQHPNILPILDSGQADGHPYYVMPFVDGESLAQRLRRETQLPIDEALNVTCQVAEALAAAAAVEFARSLYEALADGMPVDACVAEARKAISLSASNTVEWGTPVLHMRSPDGALFQIDGLRTSVARASGMYKVPAPPATTPLQATAQPTPTPAPASAAPSPPSPAPAPPISAPVAAPSGGFPTRLRWIAAGAAVILLGALLVWFLRRPGPATWASTHAKVKDVSVEPVSEGLWKLILAVDYRPATVRGEATVACTLRQGDPEQRDVEVSVVLSPDFSGGEYDEDFRIRDPWPAAQYPVACAVDGESVFEGDIDWQP